MEAEFPFVRGEVLEKMSRFSYYIKTKAMIALLDERLEEMEHDLIVESQNPQKMKRKETPAYQSKRHRFELMKKQRERMMSRLTEMEVQIRVDMASTE